MSTPDPIDSSAPSRLSLFLAYLGIVLIWATTPLAIQWSAQEAGFAFAVLARMAIGFVLAGLLLALWRISLPRHRRARAAYLVGGLSLFAAMSLTYWGARHLHSGLVSVLFGLSPLISGFMARRWLGEGGAGHSQVGGALLGALGLGVIFIDGGLRGSPALLAGLAALLLAVFIHSAALVGLKRIGDDSPPLATTFSVLGIALPFFALLWAANGATWPASPPPRAIGAIVYLGIFGSVIGFALYYYVIRHLPASQVALTTLVTPVLALLLGHFLNGEALGWRIVLGSGLILGGLALHQQAVWRGWLARWIG